MKSNIEYLREAIKNGTDAEEWIEAIEYELNKATELKDEVKVLEDEKRSLESEVSSLEEELESRPGLQIIDCGIGIIEYVQPDNLKLQCLMDDFKGQHERSKQTLPLFQN